MKEKTEKKEYLLQLLETLEKEVFGAIDTAYKRDEDNFVHNCDTVKELFKDLYTEIDELGENESSINRIKRINKDVWQRQISLLQIEMTRETKKIKERIKYWQDLIDKIDNKETYKTVVYMPDIKVEE